MLQDSKIPTIFPKSLGLTTINFARSNREEIIRKGHDIPPPKRTHRVADMRYFRSSIETPPVKLHPRKISMVVEFIQELK
jgi:hypothetical protein